MKRQHVFRSIFSILLTAATLLCLVSCASPQADEPNSPTEEPKEEEPMGEPELLKDGNVQIALPNRPSSFRIFALQSEATNIANVHRILKDAVYATVGVSLSVLGTSAKDGTNEIIFGSIKTRPETVTLTKSLAKDEYAIKCEITESGNAKIYFAYNGQYALWCAIDRFVKEYVKPEGVCIPQDLDVRGVCAEKDAIITAAIDKLRDPCILVADDGTYYAYGTGWQYYKNTSGSLAGAWEGPYDCIVKPEDYETNPWAPEVHRYRGAYYMFTTYFSSETGKRGCTVFRADSPEGPFTQITDGHVTPSDWDAIDGTFYVDGNGTPWMVFVREWVSAPENVGRIDAIRLKDDLTASVGEPIELFRADDPSWAKEKVTDGCWLFTTDDGRLGMIWSNWDAYGYSVGIAYSSNGTITGQWKQESRLLYSKTKYGTYDGGHGMLFTDTDGQTYLSIHSPNSATGERKEVPIFLPVRLAYNTIVPDLWKGEN